MQCLDYPLLHQDALPGFFFWEGGGEDTRRPSKGEKCMTKAIFGENFL